MTELTKTEIAYLLDSIEAHGAEGDYEHGEQDKIGLRLDSKGWEILMQKLRKALET